MGDNETTQFVKCCGIPCWKKKTIPNVPKVDTNPNDKFAFESSFPQLLSPGNYILISGTILKSCDRFSINFVCNQSNNPDIALHFNPRLAEGYVVRNSKRGGHWDKEETASTTTIASSLKPTSKFQIGFFVTANQFLISINNCHFCSFNFRIPLKRIKHLQVLGNVTINGMNITSNLKHYLQVPDEDLHEIPFEDNIDCLSNLLPNPFVGRISQPFQHGWQLEIYGKVKLLPLNFVISIQSGTQFWPLPLVALQLVPRFDHTNELIRNTCENNAWGIEERSPGFSFVAGKPFQITIQMDKDQFIVWVNKKLQAEYKHRTSIDNLNIVQIYGDVILYKVFVLKSFSNMLHKKEE